MIRLKRETKALGHDKVSHEGKAATCTLEGYKPYETCTRCDYTTYQAISKVPHELGEATVETAPTCETTGVEKKVCVNCDYFETSLLDKIGHNFGEDHNCTMCKKHECDLAGGHKYGEDKLCTVCGSVRPHDCKVDGHNYGDGYVCTVCGHNKYALPVQPLNPTKED